MKRSRGRTRTVLLALAALLPVTGALAGKALDVRRESHELLNAGVAAYRKGDYAAAVDSLRRSAAMALNSFRAHFYLGLALIGDRRYTEAVDALSVALDLDPTHLQSLVATGDAYLKLGDLDEAQAAYYRALKLRPEYPPSLDGLARVFESQAATEKAVEHFLRAIDSDRGFADAYTHLGDLYLRTDRFSEAVRLLEEAVSVRPDFAAGLNRLALAYGRLGLSNEAVASVRKAEQLEPLNPEHPATLGLLQLDEGSLAVAESSFHRSLELDAGQPVALRGLAEIARRRGNYDEAVELVDRALADPRLDALRKRDLGTYRTGLVAEHDEVVALEARVGSGEASGADYARMALILAGRDDWGGAAELQQRIEPSREQQERLAYMLFRADRFRDAHDVWSRLLEEKPSAELAVNDGVALAALGDDAAAEAAYRRALELDADYDAARLFLANSLLRQGNEARAAEEYSAYLERNERGERSERVRRILAQIAPETLRPPQAGPATPTAGGSSR